MRHEPCAIVFDLDDTLYARRRFLLSGFAAVVEHLRHGWNVDARQAFAVLARAHRLMPGRELQELVDHCGLPAWLVPQLVEVIRGHEPRLRLPRASAHVLATLREGWRTGILTNGPPDIQARKVRALGLEPLVDTVVYAHAVGAGLGKPDRSAFMEVARRLRVRPAHVVMVGDDGVADVAGAIGAGMRGVLIRQYARDTRHGLVANADAVVESIEEVPSAAMKLIDGRRAYAG